MEAIVALVLSGRPWLPTVGHVFSRAAPSSRLESGSEKYEMWAGGDLELIKKGIVAGVEVPTTSIHNKVTQDNDQVKPWLY